MKNDWIKDLVELKKISKAQAIKEVAHEYNLDPNKLKEMLAKTK